MKALVLAAGFGTRLRPLTRYMPKPLFPLGDATLLDAVIGKLVAAGCEAVAVNTHHLHDGIDAHIRGRSYPVPVNTVFEPEILGTGGAIRNLSDFWDDRPFFVVNSDICFDIDLRAVYEFHLTHSHPVTLAMVDDPLFNTVGVNPRGAVRTFDRSEATASDGLRWATFTGIQVLEAEVLDPIPETTFYSSIDAFRSLMARGREIRAFIPENAAWADLGTPDRYRDAALKRLAPLAFRRRWPHEADGPVLFQRLAGDGSDRSWHRLTVGDRSLVLADHGLRELPPDETAEVDAFCRIGEHLIRNGIPAPRIHLQDRISGYVFLDDLGDVHLQNLALKAAGEDDLFRLYRPVIDILVDVSRAAAGFDTAWTCQTERYDRGLILERECGYFVEAFLEGYVGLDGPFNHLQPEFERIADGAVLYGFEGLMHRDFQSRNIMVKDGKPHIIDFQGARLGPIQYDLASLLIDPYAALPESVQTRLLDYCLHRLSARAEVDRHRFHLGYRYAALARNLQILGAFGFLTKVKEKPGFAEFIRPALECLMRNLETQDFEDFPELRRVAHSAIELIFSNLLTAPPPIH